MTGSNPEFDALSAQLSFLIKAVATLGVELGSKIDTLEAKLSSTIPVPLTLPHTHPFDPRAVAAQALEATDTPALSQGSTSWEEPVPPAPSKRSQAYRAFAGSTNGEAQ